MKTTPFRKKFYNQFEKGTFSVECAPVPGRTLDMSMGYT